MDKPQYTGNTKSRGSKVWPWAVGAGLLGMLFLFPKSASASTSGGGKSATPGQKARVLESVNTRMRPDPNSPIVSPNDAVAGQVVQVHATGIASTSPLSREWWHVTTPGGATGYVSAVGPAGESNLQLV